MNSGSNSHRPYTERLIEYGPTPLAQLATRAQNAKMGSAVLQNAVQYLGEAGCTLAAAYWAGRILWNREGKLTDGMVRELTQVLHQPAFGQWEHLLRAAGTSMGQETLQRLVEPFADPVPIESMVEALEHQAPRLGERGPRLLRKLRQTRKQGLLGFFGFLANFRNQVFAHNSMPPSDVCWALAPSFLEGISYAFTRPVLLDGGWLAKVGTERFSDEPFRFWRKLHGMAERRISGESGIPDAKRASEQQLCVVAGDRVVNLSFFVVLEEDETGLQRYGFFHGTDGPRKSRLPVPGRIRSLGYVDYLLGTFGTRDRIEELEALIGRLPRDGDDPTVELQRTQLEPTIPADARQLGEFILGEPLGSGGMGTVYEAMQPTLGRHVALKVLRSELVGDKVARVRFQRETRSLGKCDHANVVRVLASGVDQEPPWFAMELVDGADMRAVMRTLRAWRGKSTELDAAHLSAASSGFSRKGTGTARTTDDAPPAGAGAAIPALPPNLEKRGSYYEGLAALFAEAALGLEEIHRHGLIHRDVKPSNLMLTGDGRRLVVMDLGLAKDQDASMEVTTAGDTRFVGTTRYASPEQVQSDLVDVDHRTDIYSLGATLYELATLEEVFPGNDLRAILRQKITQDPKPPREVYHRVPRDLETVIQKAMARNPDDRYQSARQLADDLRAFAEGRPIAARPLSAWDLARLFYRREKKLVWVVAVAMLAIVAVVSAAFVLVWERMEAEGRARRKAQLAEAAAREWSEEVTSANRVANEEKANARAMLLLRQAELLTRKDPVDAALMLRERRADQKLPGWMKLVSDLARETFPGQVLRPGGTVFRIAWSPDGTRLVSVNGYGDIRLWDLVRGEDRVLGRCQGEKCYAAWSPNGRQVAAAAAEHVARIWDGETGQEIRTLPHDSRVNIVSWSPDGRWIATGGNDDAVRLWEAETGALHSVLKHSGGVISLGWDAAGAHLATGEAYRTGRPAVARVWDLAALPDERVVESRFSVKLEHEITKETSFRVLHVEFSPDGQSLATACGHTAHVFTLADPIQRTVRRPGRWVHHVTWSPDGRTLAVGADTDVYLWAFPGTPDDLQMIREETAVRWVDWHPGGNFLATAPQAREGHIWKLSDGEWRPYSPTVHSGQFFHARWRPDGKVVATAAADGTVRLWPLAGQLKHRNLVHKESVYTLAWSPDGSRLLTMARADDRSPGSIFVWGASGAQPLWRRNAEDTLWDASWTPDGSGIVAAAGPFSPKDGRTFGYVAGWSGDGDPVEFPAVFEDKARKVSWSPTGERLAVASSDGTVRVIANGGAGESEVVLEHGNWVMDLAWSPDGLRLATASRDKVARVWDVVTGQELARLPQDGDVLVIAWNPNGQELLTGDEAATVHRWNVQTRETAEFKGHKATISDVAWCGDSGTFVSAGEDGRVFLHRLGGSDEPPRLVHQGEPVRTVVCSDDQRFLAVGSRDHNLYVYALDAHYDPYVFRLHGEVMAVDWHPEAKNVLAACSLGGEAIVQEIPESPDGWLQEAAGGCLSVARRMELLTESEAEARAAAEACRQREKRSMEGGKRGGDVPR